MIDLTLNAIQIPAIAGYTPPFGTKKSSGGLSTQEVNDNIIAGFARQRPVAVTGTEGTSEVQYNATLSIGTAGITLTLGGGAYIGCTVTVIASAAATISCNSGSTITTVAGGVYRFIWTGALWLADIRGVSPTEGRPPIGVPTLWCSSKPDWAIDFGNGASTKYLWANYPELNNTEFRAMLAVHVAAGSMNNYDSEGFYVPDWRGTVPIVAGTNAVRTGETTAGGTLGQYLPSQNKEHNHTFELWAEGGLHNHGLSHMSISGGEWSSDDVVLPYDGGYEIDYGEHFHLIDGEIYSEGGDVSKPPTIACMWIVRFE